MSIENLENNLVNFSLSKEQTLSELLYIGIQNNSLLRVMIENQAKMMNILDPSKSEEEYYDEFISKFKETDLHKFTQIANKSSN